VAAQRTAIAGIIREAVPDHEPRQVAGALGVTRGRVQQLEKAPVA
jgi:hypothetical protein